MAYNTKFSKEEIKQIGLRLQSARVLTGLNREDFAEKTNLPCMSIKNWENGRALPRNESTLSILDALRKCGISVSEEWILYGSGASPNYFFSSTFEQKENLTELFIEQIELFKKSQRTIGYNPIVITVKDDEMSPIFKKGDILGGVIVSHEAIREKIHNSHDRFYCLVAAVDGLFMPRFLFFNEEKWLTNTVKNPELKNAFSPSIACIKWHYIIGEHI